MTLAPTAHSWFRRRGLTQGQVVFVLALVGGSLVLAATLLPRYQRLWQKTPDIAVEAKVYLREQQFQPIAADLDTLLADSAPQSLPSLSHPLVGQTAPDFQLSDPAGQRHSLQEHLQHGPVVLVFYYGYYCNHCVGQLFALQDDIAKFRELGAELIAISADTPQETKEKFAKYGQFDFTVLSDPGNKTAAAYSIFAPKTKDKPERLLHGTFVIDTEGIVRWCHYGSAPFTNNATLLVEVAKIQRRLPDASP